MKYIVSVELVVEAIDQPDPEDFDFGVGATGEDIELVVLNADWTIEEDA